MYSHVDDRCSATGILIRSLRHTHSPRTCSAQGTSRGHVRSSPMSWLVEVDYGATIIPRRGKLPTSLAISTRPIQSQISDLMNVAFGGKLEAQNASARKFDQ